MRAGAGGGGGGSVVVKRHAEENRLEPAEFFADALQKYNVEYVNGPACLNVSMSVLSSSMTDANVESEVSCTRYVAAVGATAQRRTGFNGWLAAKFAGAASVGVDGGVESSSVVKFLFVEYAPFPPLFFALTRQKYCVTWLSGPTCFD